MIAYAAGLFRRLLSDGLLKRTLRQAGTLLGGQGAAAALSLLTQALTFRSLGDVGVGQLVLISTYTAIVGGLFDFQSWQMLIKYGPRVRSPENQPLFFSLLRFALLLDIVTSIAAFVAAIAGILAMTHLGFWPMHSQTDRLWYCAVLLVGVTGMPTGYLRLVGRFDLLALQPVVVGLIRVLLVAWAHQQQAGFRTFLAIWIAMDLLVAVSLMALALWHLRQHSLRQVFSQPASLAIRQWPDIWGFLWTTNFNGTAVRVVLQLDVMVVGALLGDRGAAHFSLIKKLGGILANLANPLRQVIFPIISELASAADHRALWRFLRRLMLSLVLVGSLTYAMYLAAGPYLIHFILGSDSVSIFRESAAYLAGSLLSLWMLPLMPLFMVLDYHRSLFVIYQFAVWTYLLLVLALSSYGLMGVCLAYPAMYLIYGGLSAGRLLMRHSDPKPAPAAPQPEASQPPPQAPAESA